MKFFYFFKLNDKIIESLSLSNIFTTDSIIQVNHFILKTVPIELFIEFKKRCYFRKIFLFRIISKHNQFSKDFQFSSFRIPNGLKFIINSSMCYSYSTQPHTARLPISLNWFNTLCRCIKRLYFITENYIGWKLITTNERKYINMKYMNISFPLFLFSSHWWKLTSQK